VGERLGGWERGRRTLSREAVGDGRAEASAAILAIERIMRRERLWRL